MADCTCTNFPSGLGFITFGNGVVVDNDNNSNGVPDIRFGGTVSGEGVGSTRASGGANQYGVDLYTDYTPRLSVTNGGLVGIGTTNPQQLLHLYGGNTMLQSNQVNPIAGGYSSLTLATDAYGDALLTYGTASTGAFIVNQAGTQVMGVGLYGLFMGPAGAQNRKVADLNGCYYA